MITAKSITEKITIDGIINEEIQKTVDVATDFVMYEPDNGKPISGNKKNRSKSAL